MSMRVGVVRAGTAVAAALIESMNDHGAPVAVKQP